MTQWRTLNGTRLKSDLKSTLTEVIARESSLYRLKVCIGTDSQVKGNKVDFATAIVILREGKGGFAYLTKYALPNHMSIRERMIKEVADSVTIAYDLCPIFDAYNVELEVHADINTDPQFKAHVALKEAMGYILGMGYAFVAKPHAFASSSCADMAV